MMAQMIQPVMWFDISARVRSLKRTRIICFICLDSIFFHAKEILQSHRVGIDWTSQILLLESSDYIPLTSEKIELLANNSNCNSRLFAMVLAVVIC